MNGFNSNKSRNAITFDRLGGVHDYGHDLQYEERAPKSACLALHLMGRHRWYPLWGRYTAHSGLTKRSNESPDDPIGHRDRFPRGVVICSDNSNGTLASRMTEKNRLTHHRTT